MFQDDHLVICVHLVHPSRLRGFEAIHLSRPAHKWCKALVMVVLQLLAGPSVEVRNHGKYTEWRHACPYVSLVWLVCSTLLADSIWFYSNSKCTYVYIRTFSHHGHCTRYIPFVVNLSSCFGALFQVSSGVCISISVDFSAHVHCGKANCLRLGWTPCRRWSAWRSRWCRVHLQPRLPLTCNAA